MICRKERGRRASRLAVLAELDEHILGEEHTQPGGGDEGHIGLVHDVELSRDDLSHLQIRKTRMGMIQILPAKDHPKMIQILPVKDQGREEHLNQVQAIPSLDHTKSRYRLAITCLWTLHSKILMCIPYLSAVVHYNNNLTSTLGHNDQ